MPIRQPIVCVLGHIDTGKTLLLDQIRKSSVQAREAGGITQHIGASFFPVETISEICGPLLERLKIEIRIPGLLVIDTPGHEVFANLRKRGGGVADIAILVIDVLKGFEPQTYESLDILKARKTPFLVAANKIDTIPGWVKHSNMSFIESFKKQDLTVQRQLNDLLYVIMGNFSRQGFRADRFDKVGDFPVDVFASFYKFNLAVFCCFIDAFIVDSMNIECVFAFSRDYHSSCTHSTGEVEHVGLSSDYVSVRYFFSKRGF